MAMFGIYLRFLGCKWARVFQTLEYFLSVERFPTNICFFQAEKKVYARLDAHVQRKRQGQDVTLVVTGQLGGSSSCFLKRWV